MEQKILKLANGKELIPPYRSMFFSIKKILNDFEQEKYGVGQFNNFILLNRLKNLESGSIRLGLFDQHLIQTLRDSDSETTTNEVVSEFVFFHRPH